MADKAENEKAAHLVPVRSVLVEHIQKDAEEKMREISKVLLSDSMQRSFRMLGEIVGPTSKIAESVRAMSEPLLKAQESMRRLSESMAPERYEIPAIVYNPDRTVRLAPDQFDALVEKVTASAPAQNQLYMDLMYDRESKELYRYVYSERFASAFSDSESNKRLLLFEKLVQSGKPVATKTLAAYLQCSEKQVQNLVQAINAKIEGDLRLPQPLIKANRGSGYFINKFYCVYPVK